MADKLSQGLYGVLAHHGVRAPASRAAVVTQAPASQRAASADVTSIICCDLSLDEATLARVTGAPQARVTAA